MLENTSERRVLFTMMIMMKRHTRPICLRVWIIAWILAIPLFHVHPEADRHHGEAGHLHGGTIHTVFSGDLDGEFDSHERAIPAGLEISAAHSSPTWQEHAELGFFLLSDSSDRKLFKPILIQVSFVAVAIVPPLQDRERAEQDISYAPTSTLFVHELPSRAPPSLLV